MAAKVSAAEAAAQAASNYVYSASFSEGVADGWAAGWADALAEAAAASAAPLAPIPEHAPLPESSSPEAAVGTDDHFTLNPDWLALLAGGKERRELLAREEELAVRRAECAERSGPGIDLGGGVEKDRAERAEALYGADAGEMLALRAGVEADFCVELERAPLWPVVALDTPCSQ